MILKGENIYGDGIQCHEVDDLPSKRQRCQCSRKIMKQSALSEKIKNFKSAIKN
jgi:hypothetical protein